METNEDIEIRFQIKRGNDNEDSVDDADGDQNDKGADDELEEDKDINY